MNATSNDPQPLIRVEGLSKAYGAGRAILDDVSLAFQPGEFVVILGLSGAGKSTFLRCLNRLVAPTSGSIRVPAELLGTTGAPVDVAALGPRELRVWRSRVGMIFQQFNLVRRLTVLDNVLSGALGARRTFPSVLRRFSADDRERALRNLDRVGLLEQAYQRADTLSGGQQQRVAIARALMQHPAVILADEPVASLDPRLAVTVLDILQKVAREDGITVLVSLHVLDLAKRYADRLVGLAGGRVAFDGPPGALTEDAVARIYPHAAPESAAGSPGVPHVPSAGLAR